MTDKTAVYISSPEGYMGDARLYRLDPPNPHEYVIVSAVYASPLLGGDGGPETYIFPANSDGEVTDWGELDGSFQGDRDHELALEGAGYKIANVIEGGAL